VTLGVLLALGGDPLDRFVVSFVEWLLGFELEGQRAGWHVKAPFDHVHGPGYPGAPIAGKAWQGAHRADASEAV
jgi:hypothetical protein